MNSAPGATDRAAVQNPAGSLPPLRILTIMNCPGQHPGGMLTDNIGVSRALRALGCTVDHLYLEDYPRAVRHPWLNYLLFGLVSVPLIRRLEARRGSYDVIQISGGDGYLAPLLRCDSNGRRRLIVARSHGLEHRYWEVFRREEVSGFLRTTLRHQLHFGAFRLRQVELAIRGADLFNCHTGADATFVISRRWKGPGQVVVLPGGIEPEWLTPPIEPRESGKRILYCGSWHWVKGIRVLVPVFERLVALDPEINLTVLGAGKDEGSVLRAFPPSLRRQVTVKPSVRHAGVLEEFRSHDFLLATSLFEGFGLTVVEAMAAGLPVVAAAVGGAPEYVRQGVTGYLAEPGDIDGFVSACMALMCLEADQLLALRRSAAEAVRSLAWPKIAQAILSAYAPALVRIQETVAVSGSR